MKQLQSTRIILVRHGRTKDNERRVFQGQKGGPLDDVGQRQAVLAAGRLGNKEIDAVYASDLIRASETARILATPHGLVAELDPRLREVDVGGWSGLGTDEIRVQFPEEYSAWNRGDDVRRGSSQCTPGRCELNVPGGAAQLDDLLLSWTTDGVTSLWSLAPGSN